MRRLVILTAQVSPYHDARFIGASDFFDEVHVISTLNAADFAEFLSESIGQYHLYRLFSGRESYQAAVASGELARRIKGLIDKVRPGAIAAAGWATPESLAALEYGRDRGVPTIVMSESQADDATRSVIREAIKRRLVSQFDAALVGGPPHAEYAERLGIHRDRIHYGYNVVDNRHFDDGAEKARSDSAALRKRYKLPDRYILASARFILKKNLPGLISAYALARQRVKSAPALVILGDGPERVAVEAAILAGGVGDNVHLPGFKSYNELPTFYGLSEAFAHVSSAEQWGLVINEAMSAGVPVLASRRCGAARTMLTDGVSGILTGANVPAISDALTRLFEMTPKERTAMGRAAAAAIADWGPHRFGAGMKAAVESASRGPRRGPLAFWDRTIVKRLERSIIEKVS